MLLNKRTRLYVEAYLRRPKAAALLDTTVDFMRAEKIASYIGEKLTGDKNQLIFIRPNKTVIGIETIRDLKKRVKLQANNGNAVARVVIIQKAHLLTAEAQNSLLKMVEELPLRTSILLVADSEGLLETIRSRCFLLPILPIELEQYTEIYSPKGYSNEEINKAYLLSEGYSDRFEAFISGDASEWVDLAKKTLTLSIPDRIKATNSVAKEREDSLSYVHALSLICKSAMRNAVSHNQKLAWSKRLTASLKAEKNLQSNLSTRLTLLELHTTL